MIDSTQLSGLEMLYWFSATVLNFSIALVLVKIGLGKLKLTFRDKAIEVSHGM